MLFSDLALFAPRPVSSDLPFSPAWNIRKKSGTMTSQAQRLFLDFFLSKDMAKTHKDLIFTVAKPLSLRLYVPWRPLDPSASCQWCPRGEVRLCPSYPALTLFTTKIADFPTLFKTEFRFLIPCLRHLSCLRQKLIKSIPWLRPKMIKSIPCLRQKMIKTIPCLREKSWKTYHTLAGRTSPLSPYKGVPPPPGSDGGYLREN